jgi:hypothetical protein
MNDINLFCRIGRDSDQHESQSTKPKVRFCNSFNIPNHVIFRWASHYDCLVSRSCPGVERARTLNIAGWRLGKVCTRVNVKHSILIKGTCAPGKNTDPSTPPPTEWEIELNNQLESYRKRFEELLGNASGWDFLAPLLWTLANQPRRERKLSPPVWVLFLCFCCSVFRLDMLRFVIVNDSFPHKCTVMLISTW